MSLTVEDGSGLANAESYASVAEADAWHLARGNDIWFDSDFDNTEKEQALRRATDFMEQYYGLRYAGYRKTDTQALAWPRYEVPRADTNGGYWSSDAVPQPVKNACMELAVKAAQGDLAPDLGRVEKRTKVGEIEVEYADDGRQSTVYRSINMMLNQFLATGGGVSMKVCRT
jgi:hypothetical protein